VVGEVGGGGFGLSVDFMAGAGGLVICRKRVNEPARAAVREDGMDATFDFCRPCE
jgi:hypothetical protein